MATDKLDAIADTLVSVVIAYRGEVPSAPEEAGTISLRAATSARDALLLAGLPGSQGTPYSGALDGFKRIAENAQEVGFRGSALLALTRLGERAGVLQFLRKVATSQNSVAYVAVHSLAREMGPEGIAVLRELHRQNVVTERLARQEIERVAFYHGWQ